ncbi:transmembrane 4 L6 family member 4-like [Leptodactylus fuscus]
MCTGKCSKFIGISLFPFSVISIICNLILLFPGWDLEPVENASEQLTPEVLYLGGVIGGGLLVLIPAIHIQATGRKGCCDNRCGMFLSILFAVIGVAGAAYGFVVSVFAMVRGPQCFYAPDTWGRPFYTNLTDLDDKNYLFNKDLWSICELPKDVVMFNIVLFSMILASSGISLILCTIQVINGLFGTICGTCRKN